MSTGAFFEVNNGQVDQFGYSVTLKKRTNGSTATYGFNTYMREFTIFESLLSKMMYLEGVIYDGGGFIERAGVQTGDVISIVIHKDQKDTPTQKIIKDFYVHFLSNGARNQNSKGKTYKVLALSKAGFQDTKVRIYKSFSGTCSEIAKTICKDYLLLDPKEYPAANFEATASQISLIGSSLSPFGTMQQLSAYALSTASKAKDSNYLFYETRDGVYFKTLRTISTSGNNFTYTVTVDKNKNTDDPNIDYYSIMEYDQHPTSDNQKLIRDGALENEVTTYDFISRKIVTKTFDLKKQYRDILLMGPYLSIDLEEIDNTNTRERKSDTKHNLFFRCSDTSYDKPTDPISEKYNTSKAQAELLNQTRISIMVFGNPYIKPGDTINLNVRQMSGNEDPNENDLYLNGKFLVVSSRHFIEGAAGYVTIFDLFKDGYEVDVAKYRRDNNSHFIKV